MNEFAVVVKTSDRSPRKNFLFETLGNLQRAGVTDSPMLQGLHIVDTGGSPEYRAQLMKLEGVTVHSPLVKLTLHQNAAECIRIAAAQDAPWSMVLEDDIDFCEDFLGSVSRWLRDTLPKHGEALMYPLGANYDAVQGVVDQGGIAWKYPVGAFYGNQALLWRREVAQELGKWLGPDPMYKGVRDHGHDMLLQQWGKGKGAKFFLTPAPSLVQHIGNESGIGNRFFKFNSWRGRDWRYPGRKV